VCRGWNDRAEGGSDGVGSRAFPQVRFHFHLFLLSFFASRSGADVPRFSSIGSGILEGSFIFLSVDARRVSSPTLLFRPLKLTLSCPHLLSISSPIQEEERSIRESSHFSFSTLKVESEVSSRPEVDLSFLRSYLFSAQYFA